MVRNSYLMILTNFEWKTDRCVMPNIQLLHYLLFVFFFNCFCFLYKTIFTDKSLNLSKTFFFIFTGQRLQWDMLLFDLHVVYFLQFFVQWKTHCKCNTSRHVGLSLLFRIWDVQQNAFWVIRFEKITFIPFSFIIAVMFLIW